MATDVKTYEDGLIEGRVESLEKMTMEHKGRLDNHANRLRILERAMWVFLGAVVLVQILPDIKAMFRVVGG